MTTKPKLKKSLCKQILVGAIDFGTTYSGCAFSFLTDPFNLRACTFFAHSIPKLQTPTVLLLNENKEFVAFGYDAEELYDQLVEDGTHRNYYYCQRFKMSLQTTVKMDMNYTINDVNGKEVEALLVFSESIKYLKNKAEDLINESGFSMLESDYVEWVIPVPAMWTDAAKQFMRKAAEKAGIKNNNLKIVLEPEAASILYMYMDCLNTDKENNTVQKDREFQHGSKYVVVGMESKTVDITLYQVVDETFLRELVLPCRVHLGVPSVNENCVGLLESIVGKDVFKRFAEEDKYSLIDLHRRIEATTRVFRHDSNGFQDTTKTITMSVPGELLDQMKEMYTTKNIDNVIENDEKLRGKVSWKRNKIMINADLFATFFEPYLKGTINEIEGVLGNSAEVETILVVGSCAEWPLIYKRIKSQFPNKRVIVPEDAGLAIVKGAVLYGHFPDIIVSRVARRSYGIRVYRDFIPGQHPEEKLVVIGTKKKCKDVFAVHVKKGQELQVGEVHSSQRYTRLERDQKSLIFDFFTSTSENPKYVTDHGCEEIGQLEVELDACSRSVFVWLKYGETELEAECFDEVTGKKTKATFKKFLRE